VATKKDIARFRENLQSEIDSAAQYRAMAAGESDENLNRIYIRLAEVEEKHIAFWEKKLELAGVARRKERKPTVRARILILMAKKLGAGAILNTVTAGENKDQNVYRDQPETHGTGMTSEEHSHARMLNVINRSQTGGVSGGVLAKLEGRHKNLSGNALRAAVLGANDGLVSNSSLVMGIAGATADGHTLLLAGCAGLLAGACSMALGEWISVTSSRELAKRELDVERAELEADPESEAEELQLIYEAKGIEPEEAKRIAAQVISDPEKALETLSREELQIDPEELGGSAMTAAVASFFLFALGALVPVLPFAVLEGKGAFIISIAGTALALFGTGAAIAVFTGRSFLFSGTRPLVLGLAASAATYGIGTLFGVAISG
jgi:VIT1/CCC1 family predicted Fe2+/Mn2+ transporter